MNLSHTNYVFDVTTDFVRVYLASTSFTLDIYFTATVAVCGSLHDSGQLKWIKNALASYYEFCILVYIYAKQKHLGCKKGEANQKQQLSDYKSIHSYTCD